MTKTIFTARTAGSAIAAALVLSSTPLLAQEVTNTASKPPTTTAAPATTTSPSTTPPVVDTSPITLPSQPTTTTTTTVPATTSPSTTTTTANPATSTTTRSPTMRSTPVVQAVPETTPVDETAEAAPPAATTRTTAEPAATNRTRAPAPVVATGSPDAATTLPLNQTLPESTVAPMAMEGPSEQVKEPVTVSDVSATDASGDAFADDDVTNAVLGGLGVAGLAFLGFLMVRRRREPKPQQARLYRAQGDSGLKPVAPDPVVAAPIAPSAASQPVDARPISIAEARGFNMAGGLTTAGASVPLPRTKPATMAERTALIDRLAAAKPDRANPFRSPKARRRRARMIMQSLDRKFANGSFIDLSQYPANWPHLARRADTAVA